MELSQRFKQQLEKIDLYNSNNKIDTSIEKENVKVKKENVVIENILEDKNTRIEEQVYDNYVHNPILDTSKESLVETNCDSVNNLDNLKSELIEKINKTPYWEEYSSKRQENMICSYITTSLKKDRYSNIDCHESERKNLIKSIMDFLTNR